MPSLKTSTKGGDVIALFATERRAMNSTYQVLDWLYQRLPNPEACDDCLAARDALSKVLPHFPEQEKNVTSEKK